mgnify:CR=1 FL=1
MLKIFFILILIFNVNISFSDTKETYKQLSIFNEVYNRVKNQYVEEVTDKELIEKALNGMLQALDPHSSFMSEEIYKEMQMDTSGSFGGLGIEITTDKGFIKVVSPIDDTPAYKAGILAFLRAIYIYFSRPEAKVIPSKVTFLLLTGPFFLLKRFFISIVFKFFN